MISVSKNFQHVPPKLQSNGCLEKVLHCISNPTTHRHSSYYYRDGAIDALRPIYNNKCAYCETSVSAGADLRIDHFRPKLKVVSVNNHNGYYWLTYEWSNLLLACEACNGKKSNRFPVHNEANRIFQPQLEANGYCTIDYQQTYSHVYNTESAILLNPEVDVVENHFIFRPSGEIEGLSSRGKETVAVLQLNRKNLILARKKVVDKFRNRIRNCVADFIQSQNDSHIGLSLKRVFNDLASLQHPSNDYSRLGWFMFNKFDVFFTQQLMDKEAQIVRAAFTRYLNNAL